MPRNRLIIGLLVLALLLGGLTACKTGGAANAGKSGSKSTEPPKTFKTDDKGVSGFQVTAEGGGAYVSMGDAVAAVYVPAGAAAPDAEWRVVPLAEAPKGVESPLCPGVWVDTKGDEPTDWCSIGFSLPGTAPEDATIVKLADDGTVEQVIATDRLDYGDRTFLTAYVQGFSAYTTSEEDQEARDQAAVDRAKAKGQQPDWTIKVIGSETQNIQGWTFNYELDMFASGGGIGKGGTYKGTAMLSVDGKYDDQGATAPYFTAVGEINGIGRDQNLTFSMIDPPLASLLTGAGGDMPFAEGVMNLEGMANLNIEAFGMQGEHGQANEQAQSTDPVAFTLTAPTFEDVQVEIENVGIFPGKILRTSK